MTVEEYEIERLKRIVRVLQNCIKKGELGKLKVYNVNAGIEARNRIELIQKQLLKLQS